MIGGSGSIKGLHLSILLQVSGNDGIIHVICIFFTIFITNMLLSTFVKGKGTIACMLHVVGMVGAVLVWDPLHLGLSIWLMVWSISSPPHLQTFTRANGSRRWQMFSNYCTLWNSIRTLHTYRCYWIAALSHVHKLIEFVKFTLDVLNIAGIWVRRWHMCY